MSKSPLKGLNHFAWKCRDAEETRHFYEDIIGLPLAHVLVSETVPSTGEHCPHAHFFFEMGDGSFIAFFDLDDGKISEPDPATPSWVNHIAWEVETREELEAAAERLKAGGVEFIGPTDHGWLHSIYFRDPNDIRLEICWRAQTGKVMEDFQTAARGKFTDWIESKTAHV